MSASPDWWTKPRRVAVVVDTPGWFDRHAEVLVEEIGRQGDRATFARGYHEFDAVDVAFYLSCLKIVPPDGLAKARVNLVAHASDLPKGRGFSPIVWQILEGRREIPLRLIHAADPVDSGDIVLSDSIIFEGHELNDELRDTLGKRIIDLCMAYLAAPSPAAGRPQQGQATWYARRKPEDSRLDPQRTIAEQFDLLRVVDNARYPAFFEMRGHRYIVRITKAIDEEAKQPPRSDENSDD